MCLEQFHEHGENVQLHQNTDKSWIHTHKGTYTHIQIVDINTCTCTHIIHDYYN